MTRSLHSRAITRISLGMAAFALCSNITTAAPYASGIRLLSGSTWEFVLNEAADNVTIRRDGGNEILLPNLTAGRHTFDLGGFSDFEVVVDRNAPAGFSRISDPNNVFTNFERPNGLAVNNNPASPYFGSIYVVNGTSLTTQANSRAMEDGVYTLTSDRIGMNAASFAPLADPFAPQAVVPPGWTTSLSTASAWRAAIDASDNLIVSDWSDASGGVKYASPSLTTGGLVLDQEGGPQFGVLNGSGQYIHGSIVSKPNVSGSVGTDLTLWAIDEDLETIPGVSEDGNSLWRWDVGSATDYDQPPTLVANLGNLGATTEGGTIWTTISSFYDVEYNEQFDKYYITSRRFDGNESGLVVISADGVDGNSPVVEWASGQFSIDGADGIPGNGDELDGWVDGPCAASVGTQDIFRSIGSATLSEDGTKLYVHRAGIGPLTIPDTNCGNLGNTIDYENRYLGQNSDLPGAVLVIPLDENGIPDISVNDNGTPGDASDDFIDNMESITTESNDPDHTRHSITLDAAGNIYTVNNISELLEVFSVGGNTRATTTSAGTFNIETLTGAACDLNGDGSCDVADLRVLYDDIALGNATNADIATWLSDAGTTNGKTYVEGDTDLDGSVGGGDFTTVASGFGGEGLPGAYWDQGNFDGNTGGVFSVGGADFTALASNFGSTSVAAVPEPNSCWLLSLGLLSFLARRKR